MWSTFWCELILVVAHKRVFMFKISLEGLPDRKH
jgi:hypothetical protein